MNGLTNSLVLLSLNRYYLEPASPLKSITNTAQLASTQKQQLNSATLLTNGAKSREENGSNLWTTNTITNGNTNDTANGRWKMDLLSSNDNNSLFTTQNNSANGTPTSNGFALNGSQKNGGIAVARTKNGFRLPPPGSKIQQNGNNLFTPDSDFVADFSSADIFDALNNKPSINKTSSNQSNQLNGNSPAATAKHSNGIELTNGNQTNGNNGFATTDVNKNFDENFADFEHNTIYNAAGELIVVLFFFFKYYSEAKHCLGVKWQQYN